MSLRAVALLALLTASAGAAALALASRNTARKPPGQPPLARLLAGGCRFRPPAPVRRGGLMLGMHANLAGLSDRAAKCAQAQLARDTRVGSLREDLSWADAEPQPGQFRWKKFDQVVVAAARKGLRVLPVLDSTPRWAGRSRTTLPKDPATFAGFVAAAAKRYGPDGSFWRSHPSMSGLQLGWLELWNEPYLKDFAAAGPDPRSYAELVRAAAQAGRAANPRTSFLIEADTTYLAAENSERSWIDGMYAAVPDLGRYFDAVAVHPYGEGPPAVHTPGSSRHQSRRLEEVRASFVAHGDAAKPLWVTEIGWPTCSAAGCVSEAQQASYLRAFLTLARGPWSGYVRAVFIYALNDFYPTMRSKREATFGVLRADLTRKPAWSALREVR